MNMHGMPQPGVVPSGVGVSPIMMQQASPQMGQMMGPAGPQQPPQPAPIEKIDNISKAKSLVGPLRESLSEFYSICDQIELHLKTSIQCIQQSNSSNHFLPLNVAATRVDPMPHPPPDNPMLSYPQYLSTVRSQIAYAKEIHDTLICAAQNISPSE
uniref:Mediator of RNA polymerase II transcription subunit 29 n=2 Tax=Lutzomyia longipalpis TaxID=7200 RepID=A0A1B0CIY1_LUTLO